MYGSVQQAGWVGFRWGPGEVSWGPDVWLCPADRVGRVQVRSRWSPGRSGGGTGVAPSSRQVGWVGKPH